MNEDKKKMIIGFFLGVMFTMSLLGFFFMFALDNFGFIHIDEQDIELNYIQLEGNQIIDFPSPSGWIESDNEVIYKQEDIDAFFDALKGINNDKNETYTEGEIK